MTPIASLDAARSAPKRSDAIVTIALSGHIQIQGAPVATGDPLLPGQASVQSGGQIFTGWKIS